MKKQLITLVTMICTAMTVNAMDYETAREQAYYLTDKMAYELNMNEQQYADAYEINLDYLMSLSTEADIASSYLDYRNADLRYILYDWQWEAYMLADYFYRPVHWLNGGWYFPIFRHYAHGYFFYDRPGIFWNYRGAHCRAHFGNGSWYANRRHAWNGGMRGSSRSMVGHPNGANGGRYGTAGAGRAANGTRAGQMNNGGNRQGQMNSGTRSGQMNNGSNRSAGTRSTGTNGSSQMRSSTRSTGNTGSMRSTGTTSTRSLGTPSATRSTGTSSMRSTGTSSMRSSGTSSTRSTSGGGSMRSSGASGGSHSSGGHSGGNAGGGHSGGNGGGGGRR